MKWKCKKCKELWETKEEAIECCHSVEAYQCPKCKKIYDDCDDAASCCNNVYQIYVCTECGADFDEPGEKNCDCGEDDVEEIEEEEK